MDNCGGHTITPELEKALQEINTMVKFLPANTTDLVQPFDSFFIEKLKAVRSEL